MLGVSRESVNKTLSEFAQQGIVETARGAVKINDMRALRNYD
jgi:hypothetical protein